MNRKRRPRKHKVRRAGKVSIKRRQATSKKPPGKRRRLRQIRTSKLVADRVVRKPTPNKEAGRNNHKVEAIVIHLMEGTLTGTDDWFSKAESKVSSHYGIGKGGEVHQYVDEGDTAWHAGTVKNPSWKLIKPNVNPNYYTIGIEHEGMTGDIWSDKMCQASASLIKSICKRHNIALDRDHIIGHNEIRSDKTCPGSHADIKRLISLASSV